MITPEWIAKSSAGQLNKMMAIERIAMLNSEIATRLLPPKFLTPDRHLNNALTRNNVPLISLTNQAVNKQAGHLEFINKLTAEKNPLYDRVLKMMRAWQAYHSAYDYVMRHIDLLKQIKDLEEEPNIVLHEVDRLKKAMQDIRNDLSLVRKINPFDYEEIIAELYRKRKYEVELTPKTRDKGRDIIAVKTLDGTPVRFLIECKRYGEKRGIDMRIVSRLIYAVETEKANLGVIWTTSHFTPEVKREKENVLLNRLDLKDNSNLLIWLDDYFGSTEI